MLLQPLKNIKVIDWTEGVAGPYSCQMLGDLGADIIKIERPDGDWGRYFSSKATEDSASFYALNRNKRNVCIDSKQPDSKEIILKILEQADVMITSYKPGVMERLGLGFKEVRKYNPNIIYGRISAYGYQGEHAKQPGSDTILQAVSGFMNQIGDQNGTPYRVGIPIIDLTAAKDMVIGVLSAILQKANGTVLEDAIDINLFASAAALQSQSWQDFFDTGSNPVRNGNMNPSLSPGGIYQTADNKSLSLVALHEKHWQNICKLLKLENLIEDSRFKTNVDRIANREELDQFLVPLFMKKTQSEWLKFFENTDVLVATVKELSDIANEPSLFDIIPKTYALNNKDGEKNVSIGLPIIVGNHNTSYYKQKASVMGRDSKEVLLEIGYSEEEINSFISSKTVFTAY